MCSTRGKRDFVCRSGVNAARGWMTLLEVGLSCLVTRARSPSPHWLVKCTGPSKAPPLSLALLNATLDYASGIAEMLRKHLCERHSAQLELIIVLIAVEGASS